MTELSPRKIPVAEPALVGNERKYVLDCIDSSWISSAGKYIQAFEEQFAAFCGVRHALGCCNGTVAIHLALLGLGVGPGDEVIVPTLTFVASANAVTYCGATPVFVDSESNVGNIDPALIEAAITPRTKAIMVVHLYGYPVDMDPIIEIAERHHLPIVEDAAEAHGAVYKGRRVGSIGEVASFSFFGNKIITTGEGGMVTTNNDELAARMRLFRGQGQDPQRRYWFPQVGYNYRMTNITAALGLAQLERIDWHLGQRQQLAAWYANHLAGIPGITIPTVEPDTTPVYWMNCIIVGDAFPLSRDETMAALAHVGIETRPYFYPMHILPIYENQAAGRTFPVADYLGSHGINLPSSANLTEQDVQYIAQALRSLS